MSAENRKRKFDVRSTRNIKYFKSVYTLDMNTPAKHKFFRFIILAILSITSCIILPNVPPSPPGSILCIGHRHYEGEAGPIFDNSTKYAYWLVPSDLSSGTLQVGLDDGSFDTVYLLHNTSLGWTLSPKDHRFFPTSDTGVGKMVTPVSETEDSLTIGLYRLFTWTTYYLKKID